MKMKVGKKARKKAGKAKVAAFRVYNASLGEAVDHYTEPPCRCNTEYACLLHFEQQEELRTYYQACDLVRTSGEDPKCVCPNGRRCILHWDHEYGLEDPENVESLKAFNATVDPSTTWTADTFPTKRRVLRREIDTSQSLDALKEWAEAEGITLGKAIPNDEWRLKVLQLLWTYRDIGAKELKDIPATDLIVHRVTPRQGIRPHQARQHRLTTEKEWWLRQMIQKGIEAGMYEKTVSVNGRTSQWGAAPVLVKKPGSIEPRLTFDYHFVYEEPSGSIMELATRVHNNLGRSSHRSLFSADMKHGYWGVAVHPEDRHYLSFHIPGIGQLQPTRMPQGTRSSSFTYTELMNIILGPIPEPNPEPSLLHSEHHSKAPDSCFYIDDVFGGHASFEEEYYFLKDHFFPRILWSQMKISLKKLKVGMTQIKALGQMHKIGGVLNIKQEAIDIIKNWPRPQDPTNVRSFMGTILPTRKWVKGFGEIARPLNRLQGKVEWRWTESEELAFQVLRKLCSSVLDMFGHDPEHGVEAYTDASRYGAGIYISQLQDGEMRPILYDSIAFNATQRNYDTYKRELLAIVLFTDKYEYIFNGKETSTIYTDHKPLVGFLNAEEHEDIFARWAIKLRLHNIRLKYIEGKKNVVADGLSRVIFNHEDCRPDQLVKELYKEVEEHKDDIQWFWKSGKGGYQAMLKKLSEEDRQRRIDEYGDEAVARVAWTTFYGREQAYSPCSSLYNDVEDKMMRPVVNAIQLGNEDETQRPDYTKDEWYVDIYNYYALGHPPKDINRAAMAAFKRKVNQYRWDESVGRLLHAYKGKWCICLVSGEVAPTLQEAHDAAGHFSSNIVLNRIKEKVFWPHMASDVRDYILGCLPCAQWATAARQVPLSPIQTYRPYDLFGIDFMDWPGPIPEGGFKHVCNMVDYFSGSLYPYPAYGTSAMDAKKAFSHHHGCGHPMPAAVYWDAGSAFISSEMRDMLRTLNIIAIQAPSQSHKSVGMIERANRTLRASMRKMVGPKDTQRTVLEKGTHAANDRHIEHLGYSPNEIVYGIEPRDISVVNFVKALKYPEKIVLPSEEEMMPLVWDHMARREEAQQKVIDRTTKAKQRMKERYDRGVQPKIFVTGQYVFLRDNNLIFDKNVPRWNGPFVISGPGGEQNSSYKLRNLEGKPMPNLFHGDHLRIFRERTGYLRPANEEALPVMKNLRKVRTKVIKRAGKKEQERRAFERLIGFEPRA